MFVECPQELLSLLPHSSGRREESAHSEVFPTAERRVPTQEGILSCLVTWLLLAGVRVAVAAAFTLSQTLRKNESKALTQAF